MDIRIVQLMAYINKVSLIKQIFFRPLIYEKVDFHYLFQKTKQQFLLMQLLFFILSILDKFLNDQFCALLHHNFIILANFPLNLQQIWLMMSNIVSQTY